MLKKLKILFVVSAFLSAPAFAEVFGIAFPECDLNTFAVAYNNGGGTGNDPLSPVSCTYGEECLAPENTYSKVDNKFSHWACFLSSGAECVVPTYYAGDDISRATVENEDTITLTATWVSATAFTIKFNTFGGIISTDITRCHHSTSRNRSG